MKYIIDMGSPKQTRFFEPTYKELIRRGHNVFLITRDNEEAITLQKLLGLQATQIGKYGKTLDEKLLFGIQRMEELFRYMKKIKPDRLINFVEPNSTRVAYGLGIPIYGFIDMPEAEKVCRLSVPLNELTFIPFVVPRHLMMNYGAKQLYVYQCLDPMIWLPKEPQLINVEKPLVVWRKAETEAYYYDGYKDLTQEIIEKLKETGDKIHFIELPRYKGNNVRLDLPSLLYHADLFIGGGGTIQVESAYWGTPTITTRPFLTYYDKYLISEGLMNQVKTVGHGVKLALSYLKEPEKNSHSEILRQMRFPLEEIVDRIEKECD